MKTIVPNARLHIRGLVRDKHGRPKFDDPAKIREFMHRLSEEDIKYLKEIYPDDNFYTSDSSP